MSKNFIDKLKGMDKNQILVVVAIVLIVATGVLIFAKSGSANLNFLSFLKPAMSADAIAKKSIDYLNKSILQGQTATLVSNSEVSGVVKMKIKIGANEYDTYATKDGSLLFPNAFTMTAASNAAANANNNQQAQTSQGPSKQTCDSLKKTSKPVLEAYVVARCPYGLQMQRAMAAAVKAAPALAGSMKVRYIGSVSSDGKTIDSMHGAAEGVENLRQICIREEQSSKYWNYVSCQMKNGDTSGCEKSAGIDSAKLSACTGDSKRGVAYAKEDFDLANKYGAQGSPTMILGGAQVSEFDFGGRSPEALKQLVCCSSSSQPSFCSSKMDTTQAAASFSLTYADSAAASNNSGNSGANGTNCAPAQAQ